MIHRPRVPLFAFQSLICSFHALAHSCASHPLSCKCGAYLRLSSMITALVVSQAWLCPQVWCCLIHHEEFSLLDSSESYPLIDCVHHANTHQDCQLVMNLPLVETYPSSICGHQPSWNCEVVRTCISYFAVKRLFVISSKFFTMDSSQLVKSDREKKCIGIINDVHHPYSCGEVHIWTSK